MTALQAQMRQKLSQPSCEFAFYLPKPENMAAREAICQEYIAQIQAIIEVAKAKIAAKEALPAEIELGIFCRPYSIWPFGTKKPTPNIEENEERVTTTSMWMNSQLAEKFRELMDVLPLTVLRLQDAPQHVVTLLFPGERPPVEGEIEYVGAFLRAQKRLRTLDCSGTAFPSWFFTYSRLAEMFLFRPVMNGTYQITEINWDRTNAGNFISMGLMVNSWLSSTSTSHLKTLSLRDLAPVEAPRSRGPIKMIEDALANRKSLADSMKASPSEMCNVLYNTAAAPQAAPAISNCLTM